MKPEARIELAAGLSEESVELARWVCLATRIDPALIRRARLTLTRAADAGVESDLWFGPLVQTAGARHILFYPEVADLLRRQLAQNRQDLTRAWRVTKTTHRGMPELVRLEERLTWLALKGSPRLERMLDTLLRPLIKAMLTGQREGLGRWALNVLPHMPEAVRGSKSARLLRLVSESQLYGGWANLLTTAGEGPTDEEAALLLHGLERTSAGLRLIGDSLEVSEPPEDYSRIIKVPATNPRVLEVTWTGGGGTPEQLRLTWKKGESAHANHVSLPATVNTLAGDSHRLVRAAEVNLSAPSSIFVVGPERLPVGMAVAVENNFVITTFRAVREVVNPNDLYSEPVTVRLPGPVIVDDYAHASVVKAGSTLDGPGASADRPLLLKLHSEPNYILPSISPARFKSAADFVGKVLAAPDLPPYDVAHGWATFEVGEMTEAGDYPLIPATQIKPEELARRSGTPLVDAGTGDVAGVALLREGEGGPRLTLFSLNLITRDFPEIFDAGSNVLFISSHLDRALAEGLLFRMAAAGLGDRLVFWDDTRIEQGERWRGLARAVESVSAIVMLVSPGYLASPLILEGELPPLLASAEQRGALILSLIVSKSLFEQTGLTRYQAVNDPRRPLDSLTPDERERVYEQLSELLSSRFGLKADAREETQTEPAHDFFISYHEADEAWAEWVTAELEGEGYTTTAQAWEAKLDSTFLTTMLELMKSSGRVIALLSPDYLTSEVTQSEWRAASAANTSGETRLVPVRVREVHAEELLARVNRDVYVDLVGLPEQEARAALLGVVDISRANATKPRPPKSFDERADFPGVTPNVPPVVTPEPDAPGEFAIDVFVSYARSDNESHEDSRGWVNQFTRHLRTRLLQILGEEVTIWQDTMLGGNQFFDQQTGDALFKSRLFVSVVTPAYVNSEWCRRELREFALRAGQTGGVRVGDRSRILKVVKTRVPPDVMPDELRDTLGYEFFDYDAESGRVREFTPERKLPYWDKLNDLAYDIAEMLKALKRGAPEPRPSDEKRGEVNNAVYLAETTRDVRQEHEQVRRELERRGYSVLPDQELPTYTPDFDGVVREALARCRMSVHLFGARYGIIPEGESEHSVAHRQLELAAERAASDANFVRLVWMAPGLEPADARQGALVRELQAGVGAGADTELIQAGLETFKEQIFERLAAEREAPPAASDKRKSVYLVCDRSDLEEIRPLTDFLSERGVEIILPATYGDGVSEVEDRKALLVECDAAVIYCGRRGRRWLSMKMVEVQEAAQRWRAKPLATQVVYLGPPASDWKESFHARDMTVIRNFERLSPDSMRPLLELLESPGAQ